MSQGDHKGSWVVSIFAVKAVDPFPRLLPLTVSNPRKRHPESFNIRTVLPAAAAEQDSAAYTGSFLPSVTVSGPCSPDDSHARFTLTRWSSLQLHPKLHPYSMFQAWPTVPRL